MLKKDVKIGMKVVPFQKTVRGFNDLENCYSFNTMKRVNQPYLYVTDYDISERAFVLDTDLNSYYGDFFNAEDFEPYKEG